MPDTLLIGALGAVLVLLIMVPFYRRLRATVDWCVGHRGVVDAATLVLFAGGVAAFAKVPKATLAALGKDRAKLRAVLLFHVVKGKVRAAQAMKLRSAKTLNGKPLAIRVSGGKVLVGGAPRSARPSSTSAPPTCCTCWSSCAASPWAIARRRTEPKSE